MPATIKKILNDSLPECYNREVYSNKCDVIFNHYFMVTQNGMVRLYKLLEDCLFKLPVDGHTILSLFYLMNYPPVSANAVHFQKPNAHPFEAA